MSEIQRRLETALHRLELLLASPRWCEIDTADVAKARADVATWEARLGEGKGIVAEIMVLDAGRGGARPQLDFVYPPLGTLSPFAAWLQSRETELRDGVSRIEEWDTDIHLTAIRLDESAGGDFSIAVRRRGCGPYIDPDLQPARLLPKKPISGPTVRH